MASNADEPKLDAQVAEDADYEHLIEDYGHLRLQPKASCSTGTVVKVTAKEVIVDFGYKLEGIVPIEQVTAPDGSVTVQARRHHRRDDRPPRPAARRLHASVARQGRQPALLGHARKGTSRRTARFRPRHGTRQRRTVGRCRRSGVHAGLAGRCPAAAQPGRLNRSGHSGQDPEDQPPPRQRRGFAKGWRSKKNRSHAESPQALERSPKAAVVTGVVKNLTDYGAFVDLGGIDGLLHVSDMSYGRVTHPSEVLNVGRPGHGPGPEVRQRQRAHIARHQATCAGSLGDGRRALSREQRALSDAS